MGAIRDQVAFLTLDLGARKCAEYIEQLEAKLTDCCDEEEVRARKLAADLEATRAETRQTQARSGAEVDELRKECAALRGELSALRGEFVALRALKPAES